MADRVGGSAVFFGERVDCSFWRMDGQLIASLEVDDDGCSILTMGSGTRAAVGVVTELVDVHATLGGGIVALDVV